MSKIHLKTQVKFAIWLDWWITWIYLDVQEGESYDDRSQNDLNVSLPVIKTSKLNEPDPLLSDKSKPYFRGSHDNKSLAKQDYITLEPSLSK